MGAPKHAEGRLSGSIFRVKTKKLTKIGAKEKKKRKRIIDMRC